MTQDSHDEKRRKYMAVMDDKKKIQAMTAELKHCPFCRCIPDGYEGQQVSCRCGAMGPIETPNDPECATWNDAHDLSQAAIAAAMMGAVGVCQRAINGYAAKMQSSPNKAEGRDWQTMLFAALDIKHAIIENIPANVAALAEIKGKTK